MMEYLAHSAKDDIPPQSYQEHIKTVHRLALENAKKTVKFSVQDGNLLLHTVEAAACIHDLGKLHKENQTVLHQANGNKHLPINHVDAGVVSLKKLHGDFLHAELAVYSHHRGLPDMIYEGNRENDYFREKEIEVRKKVELEADNLLEFHRKILPEYIPQSHGEEMSGDLGVFERMVLSCLVDADHSDTAYHYRKYPLDIEEIPLHPDARLKRLDDYVNTLGDDSERNQLRAEMYKDCREINVDENIVACNSPVGSGKTTAIMAHLLHQAIRRGSRRVFVVLPFTNIIHQSVEVYRQALCLPGENPEQVVAELHHRADFESLEARTLTAQWRAPIIVTTAVAFFETLASCRPAALRRFHQISGSLIFVDEAHAALPVKLLPVAWHWMQILADEWQCYWVLASGSLVEFWKLEAAGWIKNERKVPQLLSTSMRCRLMQYEGGRIRFCYKPVPLSKEDLASEVASSAGPRLLIMNTVQSAAVMAMQLRELCGTGKVMHLSTALHAEDREEVVDKIKKRLTDTEDQDWTLVATSCVEAGVDFSFKTGFREISSLVSLLQTAGRVNRHGKDGEAVIWSFVMQDDPVLKSNPNVEVSARVLMRYFEKNDIITPEMCTDSMQKELNMVAEDFKELLNAELDGQFPTVQEKFRVIDDDTILVVPDSDMQEQIRNGECDWKDIQRRTVSVRRSYRHNFSLEPLADGLYSWPWGYDDVLGIMRGVLDFHKMQSGFLSI